MSKIFFTSDTHLFHKNIISHAERPFKDIYHMHEVIIGEWNKRVSEDTIDLLARLNGRIHLILGNHDKKVKGFQRYLESVDSYKEINVGDQKICLFHYPILSWNKVHRGSWHLHGHCHFNLQEDPNRKMMDVGIDNPRSKWAPFSVEQIGNYMDTIGKYIPLDHHINKDII
jgi:calcineurin-like phosphoesterase family protein